MFAGVQKHVTAKNIVLCLIRRFPSSATLSGKFQQRVVTPSEQSLCFYTDTEQQSKRRLHASGAQVHRKELSNNRKQSNLSGIEPRFQLFHETIGLLTDCELESHLVTVKSVDTSAKKQFFFIDFDKCSQTNVRVIFAH